MYKVVFKTPNGEFTREYNYPPVNYSDGGTLYTREKDEDEWKACTPPLFYQARQDCYEKFGKDKFLNRHNANPEEREKMESYYNTQVKLYKEEKVNEK